MRADEEVEGLEHPQGDRSAGRENAGPRSRTEPTPSEQGWDVPHREDQGNRATPPPIATPPPVPRTGQENRRARRTAQAATADRPVRHEHRDPTDRPPERERTHQTSAFEPKQPRTGTWLTVGCIAGLGAGVVGVFTWLHTRDTAPTSRDSLTAVAESSPAPSVGDIAPAAAPNRPEIAKVASPRVQPPAKEETSTVVQPAPSPVPTVHELNAIRARRNALSEQTRQARQTFEKSEAQRRDQRGKLDRMFKQATEAFREFEVKFDREVEGYESRYRVLVQNIRSNVRASQASNFIQKGEEERKLITDLQKSIHEFSIDEPADAAQADKAIEVIDEITLKLRAIPRTDALRETLVPIRSDLREAASRHRRFSESVVEASQAKERFDDLSKTFEQVSNEVLILETAFARAYGKPADSYDAKSRNASHDPKPASNVSGFRQVTGVRVRDVMMEGFSATEGFSASE